MTFQTWLTTVCVLILYATSALAAEPGCPTATDERHSEAFAWRQRLAAWVPSLTFEISSETAGQSSGYQRIHPEQRAQSRPGLPASATWRDDFNTQLDWQVAAHWDVVELVESLSPLQEDDAEPRAECDTNIGAPAYLETEEDS